MSPVDSSTSSDSNWLTRTVGIVFDRRTYRQLLYLLLAFPFGLIYYLFVGIGLTFGLVLSVMVVGVVVLAATIGLVRLFAELERRLANALLSTTLRPAEDVDRTGSGRLATATRYVDAPSTWRGLSFVTMKLWTGIVGLVLIVALVSAVQMATAPLHYPHRVEFGTLNGEPIAWTIDTLPEAALAVPIGGILMLVCLHVTNAVAYVCVRIAEALLGSNEHI